MRRIARKTLKIGGRVGRQLIADRRAASPSTCLSPRRSRALAQQARGDQPVTAVVALAADDHDRSLGRGLERRARDRLPGELHQLERRHAGSSRSPSRRSRASARRRRADRPSGAVARRRASASRRLPVELAGLAARSLCTNATAAAVFPVCVSDTRTPMPPSARRPRPRGRVSRTRGAPPVATTSTSRERPGAQARAPWRPPPWRRNAPPGAAHGRP